jgi:DMSO/TMAO reductase YedYZ molybdopterin-dependent catalytic subunit
VLALGVLLAMAELAAALLGNPASAPAIAIGSEAIDVTPRPLKDFAIRTFGEDDKIVLLAGIFTTLAALSAVGGILAARSLRLGLGALGVLTLVASAAAAARPAASLVDGRPRPPRRGGRGRRPVDPAPGTWTCAGSRPRGPRAEPRPEPGGGGALSRRALLGYGVAIAAAAATAGTLARTVLADAGRATASRLGIELPALASPAPAPVGDPQAAGAAPFYTPNADFYRVDTALTVPRLEADTWSLRLHGMVDEPMTLSFADLLAMPLVERDITLTCVSNEVGGPYVGNARWTGVLLGPLLERAGVQPGATQLLSTSADGWTCGTPTEVVTDGRDAMLAVAMNGEPLPFEHGFPVRMVVPGLYGYVSATKWVTDIELTTLDEQAYWITRGYAQQAPIKISSRIDTPKPLATLPAGTVAIAGVAWAQTTGIASVEVSIDGGDWQPAELAGEAGVDTWRQWFLRWDAEPGSHRITVRATDKAGVVQTDTRRPIYPDGATGQQQLLVTVT